MMTSSVESPSPLKNKLSHVRHLLDDANKRLLEEASQYEIFTTRSSAVGSIGAQNFASKQNISNSQKSVSSDLRRTINDISTIQSVLSCPIFNRIVNVTDSLDKLSYHANLRPSIGPDDINIDPNGELILAPPIEPATLNNIINCNLDEFSDQSTNSQILSNEYRQNNENSIVNENQQNLNGGILSQQVEHTVNGCHGDSEHSSYMQQQHSNGVKQHPPRTNLNEHHTQQQTHNLNQASFINLSTPRPVLSPHQDYDTEKLVTNGADRSYANGTRHKDLVPSKVEAVRAVFEQNNTVTNLKEGHRLYKANGQFALNQVPNNPDLSSTSYSNSSPSNEDTGSNSRAIGYSNEMYRTAHELSNKDNELAMDLQQQVQFNGQQPDKHTSSTKQRHDGIGNVIENGKSTKSFQSLSARQNRASPSTSAGSTVRLADECDSGTSSFRSQAAKGLSFSSTRKQTENSDGDAVDSSIDQELIEKLSTELERIKVTLEKDENGLGITIAGYTCEQEEISGIFIKSVSPGSPADKSGKIRILDQIFAVNGQEILGHSNQEAVNVLRRHTGRVVTLELMRYLAESKYRNLQNLLGRAAPSSSLSSHEGQSSSNENPHSASPVRSGISPLTDLHDDSNISALKSMGSSVAERCAQIEKQDRREIPPAEAIYKNTSVCRKTEQSPQDVEVVLYKNKIDFANNVGPKVQGNLIPVAAQRSASTNKVIETKQGARNTVEIKSPMCQTTATATYINKVTADDEMSNSSKQSIANRLKQEVSNEFDKFARFDESGDFPFEWEQDVHLIELYKDPAHGLGFAVNKYSNLKQSIIMVTSLTSGGVAECHGGLSVGDLLIFVDDTNLDGASFTEATNALKRTSGQVRLGVLKLKGRRN